MVTKVKTVEQHRSLRSIARHQYSWQLLQAKEKIYVELAMWYVLPSRSLLISARTYGNDNRNNAVCVLRLSSATFHHWKIVSYCLLLLSNLPPILAFQTEKEILHSWSNRFARSNDHYSRVLLAFRRTFVRSFAHRIASLFLWTITILL